MKKAWMLATHLVTSFLIQFKLARVQIFWSHAFRGTNRPNAPEYLGAIVLLLALVAADFCINLLIWRASKTPVSFQRRSAVWRFHLMDHIIGLGAFFFSGIDIFSQLVGLSRMEPPRVFVNICIAFVIEGLVLLDRLILIQKMERNG